MIKKANIDLKQFYEIAKPIIELPEYQELKNFNHHAKVSIYDHCLYVAKECYIKAVRKKRPHIETIVRGALLHDFYLYDWHDRNKGFHFHGLRHPKFALKNAKMYFPLNKIEINMIKSHMWPLTFFAFPIYKESWSLMITDKICAIKEYRRTV